MKVLDDDPFFTVEVPVLRIRPCTPAEASARAGRWAGSRAFRVKRRLKAAAEAERRAYRQVGATATTARKGVSEPLPPWREVAAVWLRVRASFDDLFLSDEEEEQARVAFHQGGARWCVFLTELAERRRDRDAETRRQSHH
jgi:hypothetical protein